MNEKAKLNCTRNYDLFKIGNDNRKVDISRRAKLRASMKAYGWIPAYPMHVSRTPSGMVVKDGQHRFRIAQEMGLSVWYVVSDDKCDIAVVNDAQRPWNMRDYCERYMKQGNSDYRRLFDFCEEHKIAISIGANLLFGNAAQSGNVHDVFKGGSFKIKDEKYAHNCIRAFLAIRDASPESANVNCMNAISAIMRIEGFDVDRLVRKIAHRSDLIRRYGNREAYLDMFEKIYNDSAHKDRMALKFTAIEAMNKRNLKFAKND